MPSRVKFLAALIACSALIQPNGLWADQVGVHYAEGPLHGFLVLQTLEGKTLAAGDLIQNAAGDRITTKLVLRFKDGSVHEETTEFSQRDKFQVVKYHVVQKGPAFKRSLETSVDFSSGQVTVRYTDDDGKQKEISSEWSCPRYRQRNRTDVVEEYPTNHISSDGLHGSRHAEAQTRQARDHFARRGAILSWRFQPQGHTLRSEGGNRGRRRNRGATRGQATS
jgi:hypothetical protein